MLVNESIYNVWFTKYGEDIELKRKGIVDESGETVVELYWKQINIVPIPNKTLFKLFKGKDVESQPIFISRTATVLDLQRKIQRVLSAYVYITLRNKSLMVTDCRLWKANEDLHKLADID